MTKRVLITGANGLLGSELRHLSPKFTEFEFVFADRNMANLIDDAETFRLFDVIEPELVIHCAANVGGIGSNLTHPAEQYRENLLINTNVVHCAHEVGVKRLIAFGSSCAFPKNANFLKEDDYLTGDPYPAHQAYAWAKRMQTVQMEIYQKQFKLITLRPINSLIDLIS